MKPNKKFRSEVGEHLFKDGLSSPSIWSDQVQATKQRKYNKEDSSEDFLWANTSRVISLVNIHLSLAAADHSTFKILATLHKSEEM